MGPSCPHSDGLATSAHFHHALLTNFYPIFTSGTNHSRDYNQRFGIIRFIQSKGESRNWGESLSNGPGADEKILVEVQTMGQPGPCSPLLTQLHTYLADTSPSQTNDNKNIYTGLHGH